MYLVEAHFPADHGTTEQTHEQIWSIGLMGVWATEESVERLLGAVDELLA